MTFISVNAFCKLAFLFSQVLSTEKNLSIVHEQVIFKSINTNLAQQLITGLLLVV